MNGESIGVELTMQDLALLKEALSRQSKGLRAAIEPFGMVTTWEAENRLNDVTGKVISARCDLKRRNPLYNPAGDSECANEATDAELDAWAEAHPESEPFSPSSLSAVPGTEPVTENEKTAGTAVGRDSERNA